MMVDRVRRSMPDTPIAVVPPPAGPKVSDMLLDLAEPWLTEGLNDHQAKIVVGLAAMAWNMALLPEREVWNCDDDPEKAELFNESGNILEAMMIRRRELFPGDSRVILSYEVTGRGKDLRVNVVFSQVNKALAGLKRGDQAVDLLKSTDSEVRGTET